MAVFAEKLETLLISGLVATITKEDLFSLAMKPLAPTSTVKRFAFFSIGRKANLNNCSQNVAKINSLKIILYGYKSLPTYELFPHHSFMIRMK